MSSVSTFGTFTTARLGIYVSQKALDITGNNITNINTKGYTRQSLDIASLHLQGSDRYFSKGDVRIGQGAVATGTSQTRDQYLDIRFRNENASVGAMETKINGLDEIAAVLDEVGLGDDGAGVLEAQFNELISQVQKMVTSGAGKDDYDTLVRSSATALTGLFNQAATRLDTLYENTVTGLHQDVDAVNNILQRITDLNASIRKSEIHGAEALELRDARNTLIDELSKYMKIDVTYDREKIGPGVSVERLSIKLAGQDAKNPEANDTLLIYGNYGAQIAVRQEPTTDEHGDPLMDSDGNPIMQDTPNFDIDVSALVNAKGEVLVTEQTTDILTTKFDDEPDIQDLITEGRLPESNDTEQYEYSLVQDENGQYQVKMTTKTLSQKVELQDNTLYGALQARRELLTEQGEYATADQLDADPNAGSKRGVPFYINALNTLANSFATIMNDANTVYDTDGVTVLRGGALFSNGGMGTDPITAGNISVSEAWADGSLKVLQSTAEDPASTDNSNLAHMLVLLQNDHHYYTDPGIAPDTDPATGGTPFFTGSFQKFFTNHVDSILASDQKISGAMYDNYKASADELDVDRDSVSGVDLNDETMNMMQYQKSYSAACRLMTVVDQMLDKLINGTAV